MNTRFRKSLLLASFVTTAALSLASHADNRSLGQIHFIGSIVAPPLPGQRFVAGLLPSSTEPRVAHVGTESVRHALTRLPIDLLDYFATYANGSAMLVTAVYP